MANLINILLYSATGKFSTVFQARFLILLANDLHFLFSKKITILYEKEIRVPYSGAPNLSQI